MLLRYILVVFVFAGNFFGAVAQKNEQQKIQKVFDQWLCDEFAHETYIAANNCDQSISFKEYSARFNRYVYLPGNIKFHFLKLNKDSKVDAVITFYPFSCIERESGKFLFTPQVQLLVLSEKNNYTVDSTFFKNIFSDFKNRPDIGIFSIDSVSNGDFYGLCNDFDGMLSWKNTKEWRNYRMYDGKGKSLKEKQNQVIFCKDEDLMEPLVKIPFVISYESKTLTFIQ